MRVVGGFPVVLARVAAPSTRCLLRDLCSIARWALTGAPFLPAEEDDPRAR